MAEEIDSLFVKLGLEQDEEQFKQAQDSFDNLRGAALQFGAVIGAGFGLNELTFDFARTTNEANKLAQEFRGLDVTPQFVDNLQGAFRLIDEEGASAEDTIRSMAQIIEDTDWGEINDAAFARGLDLSGLQGAQSAEQAMTALNEQLSNMDTERARRLGQALGLSSAQIRMFRDEDISARMSEAEGLSPLSQEMSQAAEQFQDGFNKMSEAMTGLRNEISADFVGDLGEGMSDMSDLLADNREAIEQFSDDAMPVLKGIAGGIGALVAIQTARFGVSAIRKGGAGLAAVGLGGIVGLVNQQMNNEDSFSEGVANQLGLTFQTDDTLFDRISGFFGYGDDGQQKSATPVEFESEFNRRFGGRLMNMGADRELTLQEAANRRAQGNNITINVDAKNSQSPEQTRKNAERGTLDAINKLNENTLNDLRPFAQ